MATEPTLKLTLPKGRIQDKVLSLLQQIGLRFSFDQRSYRPVCSDPRVEAKQLKPQNIPQLVALGRHDCGFTGHDWMVEQEADVVELLDLGLDPVRIVAAAPEELAPRIQAGAGRPDGEPLVVASEYRKLAADFIARRGLRAIFIQTHGATEALPPEDADLIIDNSATGATLRENRLTIIDELLRSTTRFIAHRAALSDPWKRQRLEEMCMLLQASRNAAQRVLLEMNVPREAMDAVVRGLPAMRAPTVSPLWNEEGYAVKVAVPARDVPELIPKLVAAGARDILEYKLEKIVS